MYVKRTIGLKDMIMESWLLIAVVLGWSSTVVYLHEVLGYTWLVMPVLPVTLIGIAVSLYLGFKSASAYSRWWDATIAFGTVAALSREWAMDVHNLVYSHSDPIAPEAEKELVYRQIGWINAVAYMLRRTSRFKASARGHLFRHRRGGESAPAIHQTPEEYGRFLAPDEYAAAQTHRNPAHYLIRRQAESMRDLAMTGYLEGERHAAIATLLGRLDDTHGICERIKHTPFPRQIAHFGAVFTWLFIFLLPLALLGVFESEAGIHRFADIWRNEFAFALIPFSALIAWIFFMMERISDSTEDPFEGGVLDVPISTLCRTVEIDLRQTLGETDTPAPLAPVDGVLY